MSEGRIAGGALRFSAFSFFLFLFFFSSRRSASPLSPDVKESARVCARALTQTAGEKKGKGPGAASVSDDETPIKASGNHI